MKCNTCRYFESVEPGNADSDVNTLFGDGWCKRFPPFRESLWPTTIVSEWCGEHKRPAAKKKPEKPSGTQDVLAYYCERFKEEFGFNPTITGKDSGTAIRMLKDHTVAEINQKINEFFDNTPQYHKDNSMYGLNHVESQWNKLGIKKSIKIETADDYTYDELLKEQVIAWGNHDLWDDYKGFIMDTHELMTFEQYLGEYGTD